MNPGLDANGKLHAICEKFIRDNSITCPETICQSDRVIMNAYEFIEQICENVGYCEVDEEEL